MGKEAKIGLMFVGVLLVVFATLLVRKLIAWDRATSAEPETIAAADEPRPIERAEVVAPQDPVAMKTRVAGSWERSQRRDDGAVAAAAEAPRSFVPAVAVPAEDEPRSASNDGIRPVSATEEASGASGPDPFQRAQASPAIGYEEPDDDRGAPQQVPDPGEASASQAPNAEVSQADPDAALQASDRAPPNRNADTDSDGDRARNQLYSSDDELSGDRANAAPAGGAPQVALRSDEDQPVAQRPGEIRAEQPAEPRRSLAGGDPQAWRSGGDPLPLDDGKYTVQPNDTLSAISEKVYGTPRYFKAIYEHNRGRLPHPDHLTVGTVIVVPPVSVLEKKYPSLCPKQRKSAVVRPRTMQASTRDRRPTASNVYVVQEGDTLFDIARYELGKASRWAEIYELNREALGDDFDYLQPGTELALPSKPRSTDSFTRQPDASIQR